MEYKVAWFTEGGWNGKVPRDHPHMRNDVAWMHVLDATHYPVWNLEQVTEKYDLGIVTIPKNNIEQLMMFPMIENMKRVCKKIGFMKEGPSWYFKDYPIEQQIWFYNCLMEMDILFAHNSHDKRYYEGLTGKKTHVMKTIMIEDNIKPHIINSDARSGVLIGGNFARWYGGFDSYIIAQEFGEDIFAPTMGRKREREEEMNITHLPHMNWSSWIANLSRFKYVVHLCPTNGAGTVALNSAVLGIPCLANAGIDTQEQLSPELTIQPGDLKTAREKAIMLRDDKDFYNECSKNAMNRYKKSIFKEESYREEMKILLKELFNG